MMSFSSSGPVLTEEQVAAFEQEIMIGLPQEYRAFLLRQNGGRPEPGNFRFGLRGKSNVNELYPLTESFDSGLRSAFQSFHNLPPRMPKEMLPIGCDDGGNQLCLATSGPHMGSVYFWDHEHEGEYGHPTHYDNLYLINESFDAFLDSLFSITAEEMAARLEPFQILTHQDIAALERKIQSGFDINSKLSNGLTFLESAAVTDRTVIASYLLDQGAMIGKAKEIATRARSFSVLKLIEARKIN